MTHIDSLPRSITTILRDFAFPQGFEIEDIRKAVFCEEDLTIITPETAEQEQIAATLALLNSRLANSSAMIIVKSSQEAKRIYQFLNPIDVSQEEHIDLDFDFSHRLINNTIRVASTFTKFKGNCYPSSTNCIIITSYNYLLRNLLYRRSNSLDSKRKITLPLVSTYIFVDPLHENRTGKVTTNIVDSILFLKRKTFRSKNRMHFISPGFISKDQLQKAFQTKSISEVTDNQPDDFDFATDLGTRIFIKLNLPFQILLRAFSGHPTKKEILSRLKKNITYRLLTVENSCSVERGKIDRIFEKEFHRIFSSLTKKVEHEELELITKAGKKTGRYCLTPFGKEFLIASTYFEEIQKNPNVILQYIQEKMTNNVLDWDAVAQIFHNFSYERVSYDDLQVLIEKLETKKELENDIHFKMVFSKDNSFVLFSIHKLLSCFQETMTETAKKRFSFIGKTISSNYSFIDVESGKKDKESILQAVKEELLFANEPLTATQIMLNLSIQKEEVNEALTKIDLQIESLQIMVVKPPIGRSVKYYSSKEMPIHFYKKCGNCYFFGSKKCNFWTEVMEKAERKVPERFLPYIKTKSLQRKTVACEIFLEAETMDFTLPISDFYHLIPTDFISFTSGGDEEFAHFCPFCLKKGEKVHIKAFGKTAFPQQGAIPNRCSRCGSSFKLEQTK